MIPAHVAAERSTKNVAAKQQLKNPRLVVRSKCLHPSSLREKCGGRGSRSRFRRPN